MKREILPELDLQVVEGINLTDGHRIVRLSPYSTPDFPLGKKWPNVHIANHNIFRLDANNQVVWQVRRVEEGYVNWESRNQRAKKEDPACEGYFDPFINMLDKFFEIETPAKRAEDGRLLSFAQGAYFDDYKPGRLLSVGTHWWGYDLDPETGIATCTGEQVK